MDRRPNSKNGKGRKSPKPRSPPSANYSANSNRPDEAYRLCHDGIPVYGGGLMHNLMVTSVGGLQKYSKPVAEDLNGHNRRMSNVKNLTYNMKDLKLIHDSPEEVDSSELIESFSSTMKKDFPSPSATLNAKGKSLSVQAAQRKNTGYTVEESYSPLVNISCPVDSAGLSESSQRTDLSNKDRQSGNSDQPYDICPSRTEPTVWLKTPLHVKNREIRNEKKRNMEQRNILILRCGMMLLKSYISFNDQVKLIRTCRELGLGSGGFYQPGYSDGAKLNLKMMCLGKSWDPVSSAYGDERPSDGAKPPPIPNVFSQLVKWAITDSHIHLKDQRRKQDVEDILPPMSPNICIVNFYTKSGRLGLHQDKDETQESLRKGLPVVSFSIGNSAVIKGIFSMWRKSDLILGMS